MTCRIFSLFLLLFLTIPSAFGQAATAAALQESYGVWRAAMIKKSAPHWQAYTATHRQIEIRNRLFSEKRPFPAAVFDLPVQPPSLDNLKLLRIHTLGPTAKATYFGKIDFGVGGEPTQNLFVQAFIQEKGRWTYDNAEFVNLDILPEVRKQLLAGDLSYVDQPAFKPDGKIPRPAIVLRGPVQYISKVYVFCPGREVEVQVNRASRHLFQNNKDAEVVIGGTHDGENQIEFRIKDIPGGTGQEPLTIRVYLFSQIEGVKPVIAYQYQVAEGEPPIATRSTPFQVTPATAAHIMGRR